MSRIRFAIVGGAAALSFSLLASTAPAVVSATELIAEDFEGVTLGANVDEGVAGAAVWTADAPAGWSVSNDGSMPTNGVTEWLGWSFPLATWWAEAAGARRQIMKSTKRDISVSPFRSHRFRPAHIRALK